MKQTYAAKVILTMLSEGIPHMPRSGPQVQCRFVLFMKLGVLKSGSYAPELNGGTCVIELGPYYPKITAFPVSNPC